MNARLQVEHPVTELVYGVDLVREQLRIARGEPLRFTQDATRAARRGDRSAPERGGSGPRFRPRSDDHALRRPDGTGVRVDAGVRAGSDVTPYYDSLLAKIIAHGDDRAAAIERLGRRSRDPDRRHRDEPAAAARDRRRRRVRAGRDDDALSRRARRRARRARRTAGKLRRRARSARPTRWRHARLRLARAGGGVPLALERDGVR